MTEGGRDAGGGAGSAGRAHAEGKADNQRSEPGAGQRGPTSRIWFVLLTRGSAIPRHVEVPLAKARTHKS